MTKQYNEGLERQLVQIVATDRIYIPVSSIDNKLKRQKPELGKAVDLEPGQKYTGERVYARVEENSTMKSKGMKDAIAMFSGKYPRYGKILKGMIEEKRAEREINLYFGMQEGRKLTADDYISVIAGLGFTEATARNLYPELMSVSRKLSKKKSRENEERSILIG